MNSTPYPAPPGITPSPRFAVTIDGRPSFTYVTTGPREAEFTAGHHASWTSFDITGPTEIVITRAGPLPRHVTVRPASAHVEARIDAGRIVLQLDKPAKLSIECDNDLTDVLFLFANAPEQDIPDPDDPTVVTFPPGVHHIGRAFPLKPGFTYYLAPGSFLKGSFAGGGDQTRILGRGILCGAEFRWPGHLQEKNDQRVDLVKLAGNDMHLEGITLVDSPYYVIIARGENCKFSNLKILAWHFNTDGISTGPGGRIDDCFLRVADDAFKPFVTDTQITRCVLWVDRAAAFQLTWNAAADAGGSVVRDCDVIHHLPFLKQRNQWTGAVFWSWHGGKAHIHDMLFENIRIEDQSPQLINVFLERNPWSPQDGPWGRFSRLRFHNITLDQPPRFPSRLLGRDDAHMIDDVEFTNLRINGQLITTPNQLGLETNAFVSNLRFNTDA